MSTSEKLIAGLRSGPKTAEQLVAATGVSTRTIGRDMTYLIERGRAVRIDGRSGRGIKAVYALASDAAKPRPVAFKWTEDLKAQAKRLSDAGLSNKEIVLRIGSAEIGFPTPGAVMGMLNRDHAAGAANRRRNASTNNARRSAVATPKSKPALIFAGNNTIMTSSLPSSPLARPARADAFKALPGTSPLPLTERPFGACCWPIEGPDDHDGIARLSCCAPCAARTDDKGVALPPRYCAAHEAASGTNYRPLKGKDLHRSLRRWAA